MFIEFGAEACFPIRYVEDQSLCNQRSCPLVAIKKKAGLRHPLWLMIIHL